MTRASHTAKGSHSANGLDILRVYSAFVVVVLHTAAQGFYCIQPYWKTALMYNVMGRVAVPLFFMISGSVMIPRNESLAELGKRIFRRILCPYVIWSTIYIIYSGQFSTMFNLLRGILISPPFFHLSFMFQLLMLYLALPLLRGFWNNSDTSDRKKQYAILVSLLDGVLCEFIPAVTGKAVLGFKLSYFPYYAGLSMLGAYIFERREQYINRTSVRYICIYMICCAVTAYLTYLKTFHIGTPSEDFLIYQSPITMLGAVSLFVFANRLKLPEGKHSILLGLSSSTFSIYLMHPLVLNLLSQGKIGLILTWNTFYPLFGILFVGSVVFFVCVFCSIVWKKLVALLCKYFHDK